MRSISSDKSSKSSPNAKYNAKGKTLGSRKSSIRSTLRFHLSGSEDEQSLERIHTFNLKNDLRALLNINKKNEEKESQRKDSPLKAKQLKNIGSPKLSENKLMQSQQHLENSA